MTALVLCKITYFIEQQQQGINSSDVVRVPQKNYISVVVGMSTYQIAQCVGKQLGCGYHQFIEIEIRNQLAKILEEGDGGGGERWGEGEWREKMQEVLDSFGRMSEMREGERGSMRGRREGGSEMSEQKIKSPSYFQGNYDKCFRNETEKRLAKQSRQNSLGIYYRSINMKKKRQQKLSKLKQTKQASQLSICTFTPNITQTQQYFNKKNPKFFNQNQYRQHHKQNCFDKLYKQSIDLREKKKLKLKVIENQECNKIQKMSFIPKINQCSKEICKIKNYGKFYQEMAKREERNKEVSHTKSVHTIKKQKQKQKCTFHPQLSKNTKKLTQNLPSFYQRLQLHSNKKFPNKQNKQPQKSKIKRQIYTIDSSCSDGSNDKRTQKKLVNTDGNYYEFHVGISQWNNKQKKQLQQTYQFSKTKNVDIRSNILFNNRKQCIFETIFKFITTRPPMSATQFVNRKLSKKCVKNLQMNISDIADSLYIPKFIKQLVSPISFQLGELGVTLNLEEFIWAIDRLFESLDVVDRGCLLGWGVKLLPETNS